MIIEITNPTVFRAFAKRQIALFEVKFAEQRRSLIKTYDDALAAWKAMTPKERAKVKPPDELSLQAALNEVDQSKAAVLSGIERIVSRFNSLSFFGQVSLSDDDIFVLAGGSFGLLNPIEVPDDTGDLRDSNAEETA